MAFISQKPDQLLITNLKVSQVSITHLFNHALDIREDKTIETAVPLPAPFAGGSSGATPFTPCHILDATPPE